MKRMKKFLSINNFLYLIVQKRPYNDIRLKTNPDIKGPVMNENGKNKTIYL